MKIESCSLFFSRPVLQKPWVKNVCILSISWFILALGQPSFVNALCPLASSIGWALAFVCISTFESWQKRCKVGTLFYFFVQAWQLFWFTSHPYNYIWAVWFLLSFAIGLQFGIFAAIMSKENLLSKWSCLFFAGLWTLVEWTRNFWLSGFTFNPSGLSLAWPIITLQNGSLFGMAGLSFWVIFTNCQVAKAWLCRHTQKRRIHIIAAITCIILPYIIGSLIYAIRLKEQEQYDKEHPPIRAAIVYSSMLPEELRKCINQTTNPIHEAFASWKRISSALKPVVKEHPDLILLPEISVPFASNTPLFPEGEVRWLFWKNFSTLSPENNNPSYAELAKYGHLAFSSASIAQGIANAAHCPVIAGLEGAELLPQNSKMSYFNSAFFFVPQNNSQIKEERYDKQILVPMGEYIPFSWAKSLAAQYGVFDSFTPGHSPKIFQYKGYKIAPSICYEEIFGELVRKNRLQGATLFVNLTDDYWYPNSMLALQHFQHAKPRTVENGFPLIRSCNFGVSGAVDSLGRTVRAEFGTEIPQAMIVSVSSYTYTTLYTILGDFPVILLSLVAIILVPLKRLLLPKP